MVPLEWNRTFDLPLTRRLLLPLSYKGVLKERVNLVEHTGVDPVSLG